MPWTFDNIARLENVIERHEAILTYLRRVRFQIPRERRIPIDWRISYTEARMDHFKAIARTMRYNRRKALA